MIAATRGPEFTPPPQPGLLRSVGLALLAHVVLVLALSWGLKWKSDDGRIAVEAELWSPSVQQAAPKPVEVPPAPKVAPPPPPPPAPAQPDKREADIALEREKERAAQEKARQEAERERQAAAERRRQDEQRKQEQAKKAAEERKQEQARKAAEERKKAEETVAREKREQEKREQAKRDEERRAKLREETMKRIQGMAGATGSPTSEGTALRSSGPSNSYAGRIRGRVRPNIVFTDDIPGNPSAEVLVQLSPDGTIVGRRITKTSGVKTWDDAVLRALDRTAEFPKDVDGRVPSSMLLVFRPRE